MKGYGKQYHLCNTQRTYQVTTAMANVLMPYWLCFPLDITSKFRLADQKSLSRTCDSTMSHYKHIMPENLFIGTPLNV